MQRPLPTRELEEMREKMVQCRYWEEMYNLCEPKGTPQCSDYLKNAKWCFGPLIIPLEWKKFEDCTKRLLPDQTPFHCNGSSSVADESYKQFWRNLYDLRDYEEGPCNHYFIQRRKCFGRYHPDSKFCEEIAQSFRQCVELQTCPKQYAALSQCYKDNGAQSPVCDEQSWHYSRCLSVVEFANDMDAAGLGMALARADVGKLLDEQSRRTEKGYQLEQDLVSADITNSGVI